MIATTLQVETLSMRSESGDEIASYTQVDDEIVHNHLQAKLDKMAKDLEEVRLLNGHFQEDRVLQLSQQKQTEIVCEQVEMETARTILHLQEEIAALQFELDERLHCMIQENTILKNTVAAKEDEIRTLSVEWEKATLELTRFLLDGSRSLKNASSQIESIAYSFPQANVCISEDVQRAAKVCMEKEETIELLQKSLEDAQKMVMDMGQKISSLKGATMALTEFQHLDDDESTKEAIPFGEQTNIVEMLERKLIFKESQVKKAEKCANAAFLVIKWLTDRKVTHDTERNTPMPILGTPARKANHKISDTNEDALRLEDVITVEPLSLQAHKYAKSQNLYHMLHEIKKELTVANGRLTITEDFIHTKAKVYDFPSADKSLLDEDEDEWSTDSSMSSCDSSTESFSSGNKLWALEGTMGDLKVEEGSVLQSADKSPEESNMLLKDFNHSEEATFCLKKELETTLDAFNKLCVRLATLVSELDIGDSSQSGGIFFTNSHYTPFK